jgi:hypothetical protein
MPSMQPAPQGDNGEKAAAASAFLTLVFQSFAATVEVFLHRSFGSRYLSLRAVGGMVVIILFASMIPLPGRWAVMLFFFAYFKACLVARAGVLWRKWKGIDLEHSRYSGTPYLMKVFPRWNEVKIKRFVEPAIVFLVAILLGNYVPALTMYLMVAGFALMITNNQAEEYERRRALMMRDDLIESQQRAERVRSMWSNRN